MAFPGWWLVTTRDRELKVRVPSALADRLVAEAVRRDVSVNLIANRAIERFLAEVEQVPVMPDADALEAIGTAITLLTLLTAKETATLVATVERLSARQARAVATALTGFAQIGVKMVAASTGTTDQEALQSIAVKAHLAMYGDAA